MTLIQLPYFGEIDIDSLDNGHIASTEIGSVVIRPNAYQTRTQIGQMEIELDINFPKTTTDINTIDIIRKLKCFLKCC